jgi:hypothetical protein
MSFLLSLFSSIKLENKRAEQVLPRNRWGEVVQTVYTHVSKCKNDKIKKRIEAINISNTLLHDLLHCQDLLNLILYLPFPINDNVLYKCPNLQFGRIHKTCSMMVNSVDMIIQCPLMKYSFFIKAL